jgi:hypothetical protein
MEAPMELDRDPGPDSPAGGPKRGVVELRTGPRSRVMIRSAKLVCQSGEFPCVIRDASAGGLRLRLFHACPPEDYVLVELWNGETFAMQRVWAQEFDAGFRFATPVELDAFIEDAAPWPRRPIRLRIAQAATLRTRTATLAARLVNISIGGACVETNVTLPVGSTLRLDVAGLPEMVGQVRWRRGNAHGVVFERVLSMTELADYARILQPFKDPAQLVREPLRFGEAS